MNDWYLYVEKKSLRIRRNSPMLKQDDECHIIRIDPDLGSKLIHSPHLLNQYVVYFDGDKAHLIEKEKTSEAVNQFFYTPILLKENVPDPEITVTIKANQMTIELKKELIQYAWSLYGTLEKTKQYIEYYVSSKNNPNKLIEIIKVNMMDLSQSNGIMVYDFKHDITKVSIFTRKVFETYGLVIK